MNNSTYNEIETVLGYKFHNKQLLLNAFTHSSFANNFGTQSNERLEFLGDTVLSTIISEIIYADMDYNEGQLSKLRSKIVSLQPLANIIIKLKLDKFLLFTGSHSKSIATDSMKADLMEAIIGAMYIDGGLKPVRKFICKHFLSTIIENEKINNLNDPKSNLQENFSNQNIKYESTKSGNDHNPTYTAKVYINGVVCGMGSAGNKRKAEQLAAEEAIKSITKV